MLSPEKVVVVIPCLNEAAAIASLVVEIRPIISKVIVVDDGSTDDTACLARASGAEVLRHEISQGKGAALNDGWKRARQLGFEWALSMDGDGQHAPMDISRFLETSGKMPLVIGNRMGDTDKMPSLRRCVNRWMSERISKLAGQPLPDTQCGFRLMNLNAWSDLRTDTTHFEMESEILLSFLAAGHRIEFVPIQVIYKQEQSKIHPVRDTVRWCRWYFHAHRRIQNASSAIAKSRIGGPGYTRP